MSKRPPNRYSPQKLHNVYGLTHWLKTKHNCTGANATEIINDYCTSKKQSFKTKEGATGFIQRNFVSFASYASNKLKPTNASNIKSNHAELGSQHR